MISVEYNDTAQQLVIDVVYCELGSHKKWTKNEHKQKTITIKNEVLKIGHIKVGVGQIGTNKNART